MTGLLELDALQRTLNEALNDLREEITELGLPSLSSSGAERHPMDRPDYVPTPRLFEARRVALECLSEIKSLIQYPYEKVLKQASGVYDAACLNIFVFTGIIDKLAEPGVRSQGLPAQALAHSTDMDPKKLTVILRYLAVDGWVFEDEEGHFKLCRPSLELLEGARKWINYPIRAEVAQELINQVTKGGWKHARTPDKSSFQLALKTELPIWSWMKEHPDIQVKHQLAIQSLGDAYSSASITDIPWKRYNGQLFVDVGGGIGNLTLFLAQILPDSRFVIQDIPAVIELARANITQRAPELLEHDRLQLEVFDLFEPQPRSGENIVYVLRHILHDWSDANCVKILENIAPLMTATSRVFILEHIIQVRNPPELEPKTAPSANFNSTATSRAAVALEHVPTNFGPAKEASAVVNITMLATMNAYERTLRDWIGLVESAGLTVVKVHYTHSLISGIECALVSAQ